MSPGAEPISASGHSIVLFDGECNLCEGVVRFVVPRDPERRFRFAALQSALGRELLQRHGLSTAEFGTFVLIDGAQCLTRSDAALALVSGLSGGWAGLRLLRVVPRGLRDGVYAWVVRNRYRWFGRKDSCLVPGPELRERFLNGGPVDS
ncbi:MAG: thiol-disulfide oxidoreductase DCC family protein [Myxococcota bacterium]